MIYVLFFITVMMLAVSIYFNVKFAMTLLRLEDALEDCMDMIDEKYAKISEILSRPLFFDSPEVRRVVSDIKDVRNSLHRVAVSMSKNFSSNKKI